MIPQSDFYLILINLALGLLPLAVCALTSYLKISLVLGLLRQALGSVGIPSNLLVFILSFLLSIQVMSPTMLEIEKNSSEVSIATSSGKTDWKATVVVISKVLAPLKKFLIKNTKQSLNDSNSPDQLGWRELILAFVVSEFREGLLLGLFLLLPFLMIDFLVSNILVALGLSMLSPSAVSLPLKVAVLVFSDLFSSICNLLLGSYD